MQLVDVPPIEELKEMSFQFGRKQVHFLPKQFLLCFAPQTEIGSKGGVGSGKTIGGIYRATRLSTWFPGNRGLIGRLAATDLAATTRRECMEFWESAGLIDNFQEKGKYRVPTVTVHCVDPDTQHILPGKYSEAQFIHLDNPSHILGHKLGWAWIDEDSECSLEIYNKLMSRLRLPGFESIYSLWSTGNPEGHDWSYNYFHNPEELSKLSAEAARKRLSIISTTKENYYLPPEYVANMYDSYSETMRQKFLDCSFDVFDGQVYDEFNSALHVIPLSVFPFGTPPECWNRLLGVDIGGSHPWGWIWVAVDPQGNVIVYDEICRPGTRIDPFALEAKPKIGNLNFQSKVIDYENKAVAGELAERGIHFTNAKKVNKNDSVFRLSGYLHPNPAHGFPDWHPRKGEGGSPRLFITDNCKHLITQLPQQRWRKVRGSESLQNELDPNVVNDCVDALLYIIRELPRPTEIAKTLISNLAATMSKMGKIMNFERRQAAEEKKRERWNRHTGMRRRVRLQPKWETIPS